MGEDCSTKLPVVMDGQCQSSVYSNDLAQSHGSESTRKVKAATFPVEQIFDV